ncbi:MAG TPA: RNA 2',3'-cyclic phosphodiesterase [Dehalococcoidia bacterium]|nr:RNA 2',3'-cyclic phosphodiesterase [Dehalococcoidia bacterium]
MEPVRAFIAIELPRPVRAALARLQDGLRASRTTSVKWVDPAGIHLTIKFLGNIDAGEIPELSKVLRDAVKGTAPFHLKLENTGAFPNIRAPRVVWVGVGGETEQLLTLHKKVEQALIPRGFAPENRAFSPHLTLGRVREGAQPGELRRLGDGIAALNTEEELVFSVDSLNLMRSQLTREGAIYSCLASFKLTKD